MSPSYIDSLRTRLADSGFEEQTTAALDADAVFHDRTLSLTKFGFVDTYVAVYHIDDDVARASNVSEAVFRYGLDDKLGLPRGFGGNLVVYPVFACDGPDDLVAWVDDYQPSHWGAFEFPVVVAPDSNAIWFNDATPTWGFAYYSGFRDFARNVLAPQ